MGSEIDAAAMLERNRAAWTQDRYGVWEAAYGSPEAAAQALMADPGWVLRRLTGRLGEVAGRRVCCVQGSHGRVAVALARLGAQASVIDFSEENQRYALAVAKSASVALDYHVSDINEAARLGLEPFDILVLELGVLHYHLDLAAFFRVMAGLTAPGGRLLLNEFHPVQRKLFQGYGGAARDYFSRELVIADVPVPDAAAHVAPEQCVYRFWTLGETFAAICGAGFQVLAFDEHPDWSDPRLPGTYTLLAQRA